MNVSILFSTFGEYHYMIRRSIFIDMTSKGIVYKADRGNAYVISKVTNIENTCAILFAVELLSEI